MKYTPATSIYNFLAVGVQDRRKSIQEVDMILSGLKKDAKQQVNLFSFFLLNYISRDGTKCLICYTSGPVPSRKLPCCKIFMHKSCLLRCFQQASTTKRKCPIVYRKLI